MDLLRRDGQNENDCFFFVFFFVVIVFFFFFLKAPIPRHLILNLSCFLTSGFIRVREMSGKFKIFQGQGIVREFHNLSRKIEFLLKCQGNVREF